MVGFWLVLNVTGVLFPVVFVKFQTHDKIVGPVVLSVKRTGKGEAPLVTLAVNLTITGSIAPLQVLL